MEYDVLLYGVNGLRGGLGETWTIDTPGGKKSVNEKWKYDGYTAAVKEYNRLYGEAYKNNTTPPVWSAVEARVMDAYYAQQNAAKSTASSGSGSYSIDTPGGKKIGLSKTDYDKYKTYVDQYNEAYAIAYKYQFTAPKWSDFEAGKGKQIVADYTAKAAGKAQTNGSMTLSQSNVLTYSVLLPGTPIKYMNTTDKAKYELYQKYVSLYNECSKIASEYGFAQPTWAQFEAGQGENVLNQYNTLRANKIAADKAEAQRIMEEANAKAKAEAERVAAIAAEKAAAAEKAKAEQMAKQAQERADAEAAQKAAEEKAAAEKAAQEAAKRKAAAEAEAKEAANKLPAAIQQSEIAVENAVQGGSTSTPAIITSDIKEYDGSVEVTTKKGFPWWGWALVAAGVTTVGWLLVRGSKKRNANN